MEMTTCINCGNSFTGQYCNQCGQKIFTAKDKTFKGILEEVLHFLTHFEGKFFKTMRTVILRPGRLSRDYCNGIRQRYYKPISFFLMLIIIYLIFPFMEGLNMRFEFYRGVDVTGEFINQQIDDKIAATGMSESELGEIFKTKSEKTAKILLLTLVPLTAVALFFLFFNSRKTAYDYMILATEINIFVLLVFFLLLPYLLLIAVAIFQLRTVQEAYFLPVMLAMFIMALIVMFRSFFYASWFISVIKAAAFLFLYYVITQIIYKTLLFELTFLMI